MRKLFITLSLILSSVVEAGDIHCDGTLTFVMDYPAHCDGEMAFISTGSNGKWICPPSNKGSAIVLAAITAGKTVQAYIDSQGDTLTCSTLPNYVKASYLILKP